jgi:flagellar assembly protein FliH
MTATARFLFDTDFGNGHGGRPTIALTDHQAKLVEAQAQGYRNGYAAAEAAARTEADKQIPAMLAAISAAIGELRRGFTVLEARLETEAVEVAVAVANKLAPELVAREPLVEIAALVNEALGHLVGAPHLVIRLSDPLYAAAQPMLTDIAKARGFEGRLVVLADPEIGLGDCRVEWADGGITRDRATTEAAIAELVERYLAARRSSAATIPPVSPDLIGRPEP